MRYVKVLVVLALFLFGITFFLQNTQFLNTTLTLRFHLLGINWESGAVPVYVFILTAFVAGALLSMVYFFVDKLRQGMALKSCRMQVQSLEQEIHSLRTLPLEKQSPSQDLTEQ